MKQEQLVGLAEVDERTQQAIHELQAIITARYPSTRFELQRDPDDPASLLLLAITDVEDPDEVGDLVVDRVVDMIVEGIWVHVIPIRTPERVQAGYAAERGAASQRQVRTGRR